jgi:hypothetical protein
MPPTVIISVGGAIGMPQPPPGPNMPIELIPTVPPNRLNHAGFKGDRASVAAQCGGVGGRVNAATTVNLFGDPCTLFLLAARMIIDLTIFWPSASTSILRIDINIVKQDQLVSPAVGMEDEILRDRPSDGVHQENAVKERWRLASLTCRSWRHASLTSISTRPWMRTVRRPASRTCRYAFRTSRKCRV